VAGTAGKAAHRGYGLEQRDQLGVRRRSCVAKAGNAEFRTFLPWQALTALKLFGVIVPKQRRGVLRVLLREADRCSHFPVSPQRRDIGARKPGLFPGLPMDAGGAERFVAR
jgi:transposase